MNVISFRFVVVFVICIRSLSGHAAETPVHSSTLSSPFAKLHQVPVRAVTLGEGMWLSRFRTNAEASIPAFYQQLEKAGALDKLRGRKNKARGNSDADLAKWIEATAYVLQSEQNDRLNKLLGTVVADIAASAGRGGYLDARYMKAMPAELEKLKTGGHLYCLGHLLQAAVAHYQATGDEQLLDVFIPYIDNVIDHFGPGKQQCWSGHPEIELALVELYRVTGHKKYLDFTRYLLHELDLRNEQEASGIDMDHYFAGAPFTSRKALSGHAVCAMYVCCGAADYYLETGDDATLQTSLALWSDLTRCKMYITGGVGSLPAEEAIGSPYELSNERGYAETCAAIGNIMWNRRLLNATGRARFADVMELALYNGFLSGVSIDGGSYFYWNPLLSKPNSTEEEHAANGPNLIARKKSTGIGLDVRRPYYQTPCCIGNAQRMIASLPGYIYSTSDEGIWIHLYHSSRLNWHLDDGQRVVMVQKTSYPWQETVDIAFESVPVDDFSLFLRIPYWATGAKIFLNGRPSSVICRPADYCQMRRHWNPGDRIRVDFEMPIRTVHANPAVRENRGRVALQRGPVIYCLESVDNPDVSIFDIALPYDRTNTLDRLTCQFEPDLLGGLVTIRARASAYDSSVADERLYSFSPFDTNLRPVTAKAIPYFAWANRGPSEMTVWIPCGQTGRSPSRP